MRRRRGGIECLELFGNRVQAREGAAIVVLVVVLDEPWRDAQKSPGPAEQGCDLISHVDVSRVCRLYVIGLRLCPWAHVRQTLRGGGSRCNRAHLHRVPHCSRSVCRSESSSATPDTSSRVSTILRKPASSTRP